MSRGKLGKILTELGHDWSYCSARLQDRAGVQHNIKCSKCTHVLNAAGATGQSNVDWC